MRKNLRLSTRNMPFEPVQVDFGGVPMETAPLIEDVLDRDVADALYCSDSLAKVFDEKGIELIEFGGGEYGIALPMLLEVTVRELSQVTLDPDSGKKIGVGLAAKIKARAESVMKQEPYY